jgi:hypothetical protein
MGMFLTKEERDDFDRRGPSQNFEDDRYNIHHEYAFDEIDQDYQIPDVQKFCEEYSEADAKRVAAAITSFNEMGFKKFSKTFVLRVLDAAEESGLSVVAVLGCLEDLLKVQKATPTYSHFHELFEEARERAIVINIFNDFPERIFTASAREVGNEFNQETLDFIRQHLPNFPDIKELNAVWNKVLDTKYGVGSFHNAGTTLYHQGRMSKAIKERRAWPIMQLHQMWLADKAGEIPDENTQFQYFTEFTPLEGDSIYESNPSLESHFQADDPEDWDDGEF